MNLPSSLSNETYWREYHPQPLEYWWPLIESLCKQHHLDMGGWERFVLGRNIVFGNASSIIKLTPPGWADDRDREVATLQLLNGRLPVTIPTVVATDNISGWPYQIQQRVGGSLLRFLWDDLDAAARSKLAHQHGVLMRTLHALHLEASPASIDFNWEEMLAEQRAVCVEEMERSGVSAPLLEDVEPFLSKFNDRDPHKTVLLHGDLNFLNLLVEHHGDTWSITGLIDWGDAKRGPLEHEWISPIMHMYQGDPLLTEAWYQGYGNADFWRSVAFEHSVMARLMLYYSSMFGPLLQSTPALRECCSWEQVASVLCRIAL